jgi:Xaa-Pro aminopeptidase
MNNRIQKIQNLLTEKNLDAMLVSSVSNIFYLTGMSHFSKEEREAYVLITKENGYFFTTSLYIEEAKKRVTGFTFETMLRDQPFVLLLKNICQKENITAIGFEEHDIRYFEYYWMAKVVKSLSPLSLNIRLQKNADEIKKIKKACTTGDRAYDHALKQLREGITEKEIQIQIELFLKQHNADIAFRPIVCFGETASMPHHAAGEKKLKHGDCVLIDMGAKVNDYCSDMTRTVFFGKPTNEQKKIYTIVLKSQQKAIAYINEKIKNNEKIKAIDVDRVAREYIISQGYPEFPHSLGHGIGIDVHEHPSLSMKSETILEPGMVFSIEPGIYLPDFMGVRIEDIVVLEKTGLQILTLSSKEIIVL